MIFLNISLSACFCLSLLDSVEGLDQRSSIPPHPLLLKDCGSSIRGEDNPGRHVLKAPLPCRPQPIKSLPWNASESSDWLSMAAAANNLVVQASPKSNLQRFTNSVPTSQHFSPRRQVFESPWPKQGSPQPPAKEPTVLFRLVNLPEHTGSQTKSQEQKELPASKAEMASGEVSKELNEGPLDLSDRGNPKSRLTPKPSDLQGGERLEKSADNDVETNLSPHSQVASPSPAASPSSSSALPVKQQEEEPSADQNLKVMSGQSSSGTRRGHGMRQKS